MFAVLLLCLAFLHDFYLILFADTHPITQKAYPDTQKS